MQGMRWWPLTRAIALALVALDGLTPLPLAAAAVSAQLSAIPPPSSCGDLSPVLPDTPGADEYRAFLNAAVAYLAAPEHLNRSLGVPQRVVLCPEDDALGDGAQTVPTYAGDTVSGCTFPVYPKGVALAGDKSVGMAMMTHEAFHCFLSVRGGRGLGDPPTWFWEGSAAWVGESATGGSAYSTNWWQVYLTQPRRSLFERDYSAIGFFAHLGENGIDPWRVFDTLTVAARTSTPVPLGMNLDQYLFGLAIAENPTSFLNSWAAGLARDSTLGPAWDTSGPGITADTYAAPVLDLGGTLEVPEAANELVSIVIDGDVIHMDATPDNADGRLRALDGTEYDLTTADFCARSDGCGCPPSGAPGAGDTPRLAPGPALLAVTGHVPTQAQPASGTRIRLSSSTLADFCAARAGGTPGSGAPTVTPAGPPGSDRCAGYDPGVVLLAQVEREASLIQSECFYTIVGWGWTWVRFHDPPFTLADGRPADVATAMAAAVSNAVANGIGDDHAPVKVQAVSSSGGVCITPAERPTRNDVRGHLFVQRGKSWMDVELLDTRANSFRGYPPLCDMLGVLAASVP